MLTISLWIDITVVFCWMSLLFSFLLTPLIMLCCFWNLLYKCLSLSLVRGMNDCWTLTYCSHTQTPCCAGVCGGWLGEYCWGLLWNDTCTHQVTVLNKVLAGMSVCSLGTHSLNYSLTHSHSLSRAIAEGVKNCQPRVPPTDIFQDFMLLSGSPCDFRSHWFHS